VITYKIEGALKRAALRGGQPSAGQAGSGHALRQTPGGTMDRYLAGLRIIK